MAALLVLIVVVVIHELGHFLVARACGVSVAAFSFGFGPEIVGFTDSKGTRWKFSLFPIGGFVRFVEDTDASPGTASDAPSGGLAAAPRLPLTGQERANLFVSKPLWQRAAVLAAGPMANFMSAILAFAAIAYFFGTFVLPAQVEVMPDNPAAAAGLRTGDVVTAIDGKPLADFSALSDVVSKAPGRALAFDVLRDGATVSLKVTPQERTVDDGFGGKVTRGIIGVRPGADRSKLPVNYPGVLGALAGGVEQTWGIITTTLGYLYDVLTWRQSGDKIGGLPTIIDVSNQIAKMGIAPLVQWMGLISVSIGLLNLFPIPPLDGGHLLYYAFEAILGRPLSDEVQELGFRIGFALVSTLMVFALWNDRFRMLKWFS